MISIYGKVKLQQLRKAKYSILGLILHIVQIFFLTETHTYFCNTLCKNREKSFKKCEFLEKFVLLFFFEQDQLLK